MLRKTKQEPYSPRVLDYPATMSEYERESLAAEEALRLGVRQLSGSVKMNIFARVQHVWEIKSQSRS
jgi:hypothetical protein